VHAQASVVFALVVVVVGTDRQLQSSAPAALEIVEHQRSTDLRGHVGAAMAAGLQVFFFPSKTSGTLILCDHVGFRPRI